MGRQQQWVYRVEPSTFPADFPERLDRLRVGGGYSWRGLARALRVDARMLRRWRRGTKPGPGHLAALYAFALDRDLPHCLLPPASGISSEPVCPGCARRLPSDAAVSKQNSDWFATSP